MLEKQQKRQRIHKKIRTKIFGTKERPRLCVFRSANHIYAQLIDDEKSKVLVAVSDLKLKKGNLPSPPPTSKASDGHGKASIFAKALADKSKGQGKMNRAMEVGKLIAKEAIKKKIERVVFDRGGFTFHGRIKSVADGAREGGLKF